CQGRLANASRKSSPRTQGPIRRGPSIFATRGEGLRDPLTTVVMGPCVRRDDGSSSLWRCAASGGSAPKSGFRVKRLECGPRAFQREDVAPAIVFRSQCKEPSGVVLLALPEIIFADVVVGAASLVHPRRGVSTVGGRHKRLRRELSEIELDHRRGPALHVELLR